MLLPETKLLAEADVIVANGLLSNTSRPAPSLFSVTALPPSVTMPKLTSGVLLMVIAPFVMPPESVVLVAWSILPARPLTVSVSPLLMVSAPICARRSCCRSG